MDDPIYKKGDLVILNDFGELVVDSNIKVGVVASDPYSTFYPPNALEGIALEYWTYDVLFGSQLINLIPETLSVTNLNDLVPECLVNVEIDQNTIAIVETVEKTLAAQKS